MEQHFFATDYLDPQNSIVVVLAKSGTCRKVWSHKLSFGGPPPDENAFLANMKAASQDNENWNVNNAMQTTAEMIYLCTVPAELTFRIFGLHSL